MKKFIKIFFVAIVFFAFSYRTSNAYVNFDIEGGEIKKIKILFDEVSYDKTSKHAYKTAGQRYDTEDNIKRRKRLAEKIMDIVENDLNMVGLFGIERDNVENAVDEYTGTPDFQAYQALEIDAFITIELITVNSLGEVGLGITLWDILDERMSFGRIYSFSKSNYRKVGHILADQLYMDLTGEEIGIFNSRIAYIAESGNARKRDRKIITMDIDGKNKKEITYKNKTLITPLFSRASTNELFFAAYQDRENLKTYKVNLLNGIIYKIGDINDMTFSPNYNPVLKDNLILSSTKNGITDIYTIDLANGSVDRLTNRRSIDTTPSYSPDGEQIVFCSDRSGGQKLFIMDEDGSNARKLTKARGQYSKPAWSPDGRLIAFVKISQGRFSLGVINPDGENERILVNAYMVEGVRWSPNGRYLIYSKQRGPYGKASIPYVYILDILTGYEHRIPTPLKEGATDPDWVGL